MRLTYKMKRATKIAILVFGILAIMAIGVASMYNRLVSAEEMVKLEWSNVESTYQRRADLIPNLVATVKGYAEHEATTLEAVVAARSKATQMTVDPAQLNDEYLANYQAMQGEIGSALGRLLAITENYPDLKANENFKALQEQLEGTENRILVARREYNAKAQAYNKMARRFPNNIFASMFGFELKPYFKAEESSSVAPQVQF